MKKVLFLASVLTACGLTSASWAQDNGAPASAPAPAASPLSFNVGLFTDYRYRGISQSRLEPAIQGGLDFAVPNTGWYLGAWGSTISWIKDAGASTLAAVNTGNAPVELDFYGGYKGSIKEGLAYDLGLLAYAYPDNSYANIAGAANANTAEAYGALTFGPATLKYSHSLTTLFGFGNSRGSHYLDLSAGFDAGNGIMITPHVGYQRVRNNSSYSYTDYSVTISKDFKGFLVSGGIIGTDTQKIDTNLEKLAYPSPEGKDLGRASLFAGVKYTF
jgi:uncharacterized protein (TIGR02001 family)